MTGNDGTGNLAERDEWETPKWLFDQLEKNIWFNFDCCANENNKKCTRFSRDFLNLEQLNDKVCWMNPPFTKAEEMFKHFFKIVERGICIYRCDNMETKIWQDIILKNATWIFIPKGRISYEGMEGEGSRFPSALIGFNVDSPNYIDGITFLIKEVKK